MSCEGAEKFSKPTSYCGSFWKFPLFRLRVLAQDQAGHQYPAFPSLMCQGLALLPPLSVTLTAHSVPENPPHPSLAGGGKAGHEAVGPCTSTPTTPPVGKQQASPPQVPCLGHKPKVLRSDFSCGPWSVVAPVR